MGHVISFFVAVMVAAFAAWFQYQSWRKQDRVRIEEKEQKMASELISEFSRLASRRLYRQKRYFWSLRSGVGINEERACYDSVLHEWNESLTDMLSRFEYSFGKETVMFIENSVQSRFYEMHGKINDIKKCELENIDLDEVEEGLNYLGSLVASTSRDLRRRVRGKRFSILSDYEIVSFSNRKNLSVGFLISKLLGIGK